MSHRRVCLFVPGDRPERIVKAVQSGADTVIIDLEDAVEASQKVAARQMTIKALKVLDRADVGVGVRINAWSTGLAEEDIDELSVVFGVLDFLMLPMVESVDDVLAVTSLLSQARDRGVEFTEKFSVIPLLETARGIYSAREVALLPLVERLAFGPADLSNQLGISPTAEGTEFLVARSEVVLACAAAGIGRPLDGPYMELTDDKGLSVSAQGARRLGFGGKQILHPRQIAAVRAEFAVSAEDRDWAERVDNAFREAEQRGVASIQLGDGTFIDYPIAQRARAILSEPTEM